MNKKIIIYLLSRLCLVMAFALAIPAGYALVYGENSAAAFGQGIIVALVLGLILHLASRGFVWEHLTIRDGISVVLFSWLLIACLGATPYYLYGILDPASSFFESMSGFTTTGSTAIADLEIWPKSILLWRSLTHWIGGIGIIMICVALLPQFSGGASVLFNTEVTGFTNSRILPRIRTTSMVTLGIYVGFTAAETLALMLLGLSGFDAVNHAISAIATGGFSTYNASVAQFDNAAVEYVLALGMVAAGGNFALYFYMTQYGFKALWRDTEFKTYICIILSFSLLITANIMYYNGYDFSQGFRYAFFQVASFGSTTGYVSADYDQWPASSRLILGILYLVGACAGSTAGGIKVCRIVVLFKTLAAEIKSALHPQLLANVSYNGKKLAVGTLVNISRFFFLYIFIIVCLSLLLSATGLSIESSIFGVAASLSSVGPAMDALGATSNYAGVTSCGKLILCLAMLLGRLELFTVLVLLRKDFWRNTRRW